MNTVLAQLSESFTIALADRVRQMKREGVPVIALKTGDPDFKTPREIMDAAYEAMADGFTHYSNSRGLPHLQGLENAAYFVRDGGVLILAAECRGAIGNKTFEEWMVAGTSPQDILERIQKEFVLGGHKAAGIANIERRAKVYLVSSMPDELVQHLFMTPAAGLNEALDAALQSLGSDSQVLVLPQAGSIIPDFEN